MQKSLMILNVAQERVLNYKRFKILKHFKYEFLLVVDIIAVVYIKQE